MILPSGFSTYDYSIPSNLKGWGPGWPNCGNNPTRTVRASRSGTEWTNLDVRVADLFEIIINEIERRGYMFHPGWNWGGHCRAIAGTNKSSNHAWKIAADLDAPLNPYTILFVHSIPDWAYALFRAYGFGLGADYKGKKDWMHVEAMGTPSDMEIMTKLARRAFVTAVHEQPSAPSAPPAPAPIPADWLRQGYKGDRVVLLQRRLNAWGIKVDTDGDFGPLTHKAVVTFQSRHGFPTSGVVDPWTWDRLHTNPPSTFPGTVQRGSTGIIVKDVQDRLVERGYLTAAKRATGYGTFGPATHDGVVRFQRDNKLTPDGIVGPKTWAALHP